MNLEERIKAQCEATGFTRSQLTRILLLGAISLFEKGELVVTPSKPAPQTEEAA